MLVVKPAMPAVCGRTPVLSSDTKPSGLVPSNGAPSDAVHIELDDSTRASALRDYFLRLGAQATLNADSTVDVRFDVGEEVDVQACLHTWAATNGVTARTIAATGPPIPATPEIQAKPEIQTKPEIQAKPEVGPRGANPFDPPVRLGDLMVSKGFITVEQLSQALVESRESGQLVGRVLLRRGWVFEDELARALAEQWKLPYARLSSVGVDQKVMRLLPREVGMRVEAVPVRFSEQSVLVAFADPSDPEALAAVREYLPEIKLAVAEFSDIRMLWQSVAA
jgi:hypothetical protein